MPPFRRVAIVGLGVMGGSLARALATLEDDLHVRGFSPDPEEGKAALSAGAVREAPRKLAEAVADAELVVLAAPLEACRDLLPQVAVAAPDAVLTDVASLKRPMARAAESHGLQDRWVGCHPMVGSERSGFAASSADLYGDALVWITLHPDARGAAADGVESLWRSVGAHTQDTDIDAHDTLMALASHLPQLATNALALVMESAGATVEDLGPGGRDATRLAASDPVMWRDILAHAPPELVDLLREVGVRSLDLAQRMEAGDLEAVVRIMETTRRWREEG